MNRQRKMYLATAIIYAILFFAFLFVGYSLNITEIKDSCFYNYTKLEYTIIFINLALVFVVFALINLLFCFITKNTTNSKNSKLCYILLLVALAVGVLISLFIPMKSLNEVNISPDLDSDADNVQIESKYENYFPFYKDFQRLSNGKGISDFGYSETEVQSNKYVHISNGLMNENNSSYDVQYFSSNCSFVTGIYSNSVATKSDFYKDKKFSTGVYGGINYSIYESNDYFELRIVDNNKVFSMFLKSYNDFTEYNKAEFIKLAVKQYKLIKANCN